MANVWFRLYSEFADDPKVQSLPEPMQRRLVMLMCMKCKDVTFQERFVTFHWRVTPTELADTKALFVEHGFIDSDWNLLNWNKRQFVSDSSTERTRRYRERHETSQNGHGDGHGTKCDALDTDTEADTKVKAIPRFASRDAEAVYATYPRKVGKRAALKAILSALNRLDSPDPVCHLIGITKEFAKSPAGQRGEFTPHPATFFNQSRYLDDPEEWEKVR